MYSSINVISVITYIICHIQIVTSLISCTTQIVNFDKNTLYGQPHFHEMENIYLYCVICELCVTNMKQDCYVILQ